MKRIAMSIRALKLLAAVPNVPQFDEIQTYGEAAVVTFNDDADVLKLNAARAAAAENQEFLMELARGSVSSDSLETKMQRWAHWLKHGLIDLDKSATQPKVQSPETPSRASHREAVPDEGGQQ